MTITNSLYIGISGLDAHGDAISVVGDNIANASTVGYKSQRAEFSDLLGGELGTQRLGGGVKLSGTETMFTQGAIQQTGNPLDLAIQGGGFFAVSGTHDGQTGQFYTRDGQFTLDNSGYIVNQQGMRLQGYAIDSTGATSSTLGDLPVGARQSPPVATTTATMNLALNSNDPTVTVTPFDPANSASYSYNTSQTTYDSLGNAHSTQMFMVKTGAGTWDWHAMVDGKEVNGGTPGTPSEIASGTMTFNTDGTLQTQTTTASSADFVGAKPGQSIKFSFGDDIASGGTGQNGTTQTAIATDGVISVNDDGHPSGNLTSVNITSDGKIEGIYDNGDNIEIAKVALAQFGNQEGLARSGDGLMTATQTSGQAVIDGPGVGSRGSIASGALEASNVDIGNELVTLIAYQRAFEANAKTITTADQMMTDVTNLKQ
jgi:flagellar hook protein FlgE